MNTSAYKYVIKMNAGFIFQTNMYMFVNIISQLCVTMSGKDVKYLNGCLKRLNQEIISKVKVIA